MGYLFNQAQERRKKFEVKLSARIKNWVEVGASTEGLAFAKFGGKAVNLYVDDNGRLRLEGGGSKFAGRISDNDLDFLADSVGGIAKFKGLQVRLSVNERGNIGWSGAVKIPGVFSKFGIGGKVQVSGELSLIEFMGNTPAGLLIKQYSRGTMNNCEISNPEAC